MIFRNLTQILCWIVIVNCTIKDVRAVFFDELFEYFLDGIGDSDESSSNELSNSNLNVTCKNCTFTVECHNCTQSDKDSQSTTPMQVHSQNNQHPTSPSLPTPTIPAPQRVVEIVSNNNASPASQNTSPTPVTSGSTSTKPAEVTSAPASPSQTPNTKSIGDQITGDVTGDDTNTSTADGVNSSDGVTDGNTKK